MTSGWSRREKPAFVGTFEWGLSWGAQPVANWRAQQGADTADTPYYEHELPAEMASLAEGIPESRRFDAVIVDEAQDFAEEWWQPVLGALRDPESGGLYLYADANQRGSSSASESRRFHWSLWCWTTTCATPPRSAR